MTGALLCSFGKGRDNTAATRENIIDTNHLADLLLQGTATDAWWSPHVWSGNRRKGDQWESASGVALDVDYHDAQGEHTAPPEELRARLFEAAQQGGATLFYGTPRGGRCAWLFQQSTTDATAWTTAANECADRIDALLGDSGFSTDRGTLDLARLFFGPNARVDGVQRRAEVRVLGDAVQIADLLPAAEPEPEQPSQSLLLLPPQGRVASTAYTDHEYDLRRARWVLLDARLLSPDAGYDTWLKVGMALQNLGDEGLALWREWSVGSKDWNEREIVSKWPGFAGRVTVATLFHMCNQAAPEWRDRCPVKRHACADRRGPDGAAASVPAEPATTTEPRRLRIYTEEELRNLPPPRALVAGLLAEGINVFASGPKVGKTHVCNAIAFAMTNGAATWMGREIQSGPVLFSIGEGMAGQGQRWRGLRQANPVSRLMHPMLFCPAPNLLDAGECRLFEDVLAELRPRLCILDTYAAHTPGMKENDTEHVGPFVRRLVQWRERLGVSWLLPHHLRKLEPEAEPTLEDVRGSSSLVAAADGVAVLFRHPARTKNGTIVVRTVAMRDMEEGEDLRLRLLPVELPDGGRTAFAAPALELAEAAPVTREETDATHRAAAVGRLAQDVDLVVTALRRNGKASSIDQIVAQAGMRGTRGRAAVRQAMDQTPPLIVMSGPKKDRTFRVAGTPDASPPAESPEPSDTGGGEKKEAKKRTGRFRNRPSLPSGTFRDGTGRNEIAEVVSAASRNGRVAPAALNDDWREAWGDA